LLMVECVDWTLVLEVFGEVDRNKNLADTGVHEEDGSLLASELEGNNGVLEDLNSGDFGQAKLCLAFAFESGASDGLFQKGCKSPDNVNKSTVEFEEVATR
jgi:hypothetical protein